MMPSLSRIANGEVQLSKIRDINIENLLGREPVRADNRIIADKVRGHAVMMTGGRH